MNTGGTPSVEFEYNYRGKRGLVVAKCEWYNPTGSIKDRAAEQVIADGYESGRLRAGQEIVEATSGNMGIALASAGVRNNHPVTLFIPKSASAERIKLIKLLGARVEIVEDLNTAVEDAREYAKANKSFYVDQFNNRSCIRANEFTGMEIREGIEDRYSMGDFDEEDKVGFACGYGSGGTIMGVARELRNFREMRLQVCTVKPTDNPTAIEGLNSVFKSNLLDEEFIDTEVSVTDKDAIAMAQKLNKLGIPVGISGGANVLGAILSELDIVFTILPDDNKKYLSTALMEELHTELVDKIKLDNIFIK